MHPGERETSLRTDEARLTGAPETMFHVVRPYVQMIPKVSRLGNRQLPAVGFQFSGGKHFSPTQWKKRKFRSMKTTPATPHRSISIPDMKGQMRQSP